MIVGKEIAPETIAAMTVEDLRRGFSYSSLVSVKAAAADGEGGWLLNCAFPRRISKELLRILTA